ncbi:MAG: glycosyltransferase family 39 protein, partial [Chloroflexota bacterium]
MVLGAVLRVWGIAYGLPYTYPADEPNYLLITLKMLQNGDPNPHWWFYPSLMFYLNALALMLYFLAGRVLGLFSTFADLPSPQIITMGVGVMPQPGMLLTARALDALFSVAAIGVLYLIARRAHPNRVVALVAALSLAVSPAVVAYSQQIGPDTFALFFSLVSVLFAIWIVDDPRTRNYVGAGIGAGLAIASKYNAAVILVSLIVAHLARFGWRGVWRRELFIGMIAAALAFFVGTPFAIFDFPNFIEGVRWQIFSYSVEGHAGEEGNAFAWYVAYLLGTEGLAALGAVIGMVYAFFARAKKYWVVLSFPLIYFLIVSQMVTRNARTIMLIVPFLGLLAAIVIVELCDWLERTGRVKRSINALALLAFVFLLVVVPTRGTLAADLRIAQPDGREIARQWIAANLPPGSRIALEAY